MIEIKKGIDIPILGKIKDTENFLEYLPSIKGSFSVGITGSDFVGFKPTLKISEGDLVKIGQPILEDKKNPGVFICSPVAGKIAGIKRGKRRRLLSIDIEPSASQEKIKFSIPDINSITRSEVIECLQKSGLWSLFRTRPFSKIPHLEQKPHSIFVNTIDSNPLSFDPLISLNNRENDFQLGLNILSTLTDGLVHVCHLSGKALPKNDKKNICYHSFSGVHPVGLVGTHIHYLDPVSLNKTVWHLDLQSLIAIGSFFRTGEIDNTRIIAVAGPGVKNPILIKTVIGVNCRDILQDNLLSEKQRIISGSILSGRKITPEQPHLGYYDRQISVLPEDGQSVFLEFVRPGIKTFSKSRAYLGRFLSNNNFKFTTSLQGSPRPFLPYGIHENVMPLDILPTLLLRALLIKDTDTAINLGALELDEEDIALLTYVDPGKHDFGAVLRENLDLIEKEG